MSKRQRVDDEKNMSSAAFEFEYTLEDGDTSVNRFNLDKIVVMGFDRLSQFTYATQHGVWTDFYDLQNEAKRLMTLLQDNHGWKTFICMDTIVNPRHVLTWCDDNPITIDISSEVFKEIEPWCY